MEGCGPAYCDVGSPMGFFSNLFTGDGEDVPDWASFFSGRQFHEFIANVESYFHERGVTIQIDDGVVTSVAENEANAAGDESSNGEGFGQLGLHNLSQMCAQVEEREWPEIIANHFGSLEQTRPASFRAAMSMKARCS